MEQSVAVEQFITRIKPKYIERRLNREKQWPPCKPEQLVRLELVEGEQRQGYSAGQTRGRSVWMYKKNVKGSQALAYADILKPKDGKKIVRKILVEGDAGIGKTTLCTALSEDWASGKLFQEFEILLLLHLRQKKIASAGSLLGLLKLLYPSRKVYELVAEYIEEQEGKVLIIADGWDELSTEDRSETSFLYELLFSECYSLSVIVTSRPSASAPLRNHFDRLVEIHGFNEDNIKEFIQCEFAGHKAKGSGLLEQLEGNPIVENVCSVPLNCAIVCHLWHHFKGALPTTMTELYTKIILNIILRNVQKILKYGELSSLPNFDALPESLKQPWSHLCELAFFTLSEDKIVFSHEDLNERFPHLRLDEEIFCFGLLQSAESIMEVGHGVSFHFLHLTIQEYLAALYAVRQPPDVQLKLIQSHVCLRFEMVWRFFFGISCTVYGGQNGLDAQVSKLLIDAYYSDLTILPLYHFGLEANQRDIDFYIASKLSYWKSKNFSSEPTTFFARTAHNFTAVVYIISRIALFSNLEIEFKNFDLRDEQIAALADALVGNDVMSVILQDNHLTDQRVADLFERASPAFYQSLRRVCIHNNGVGPKAIKSITTLLGESLLSYDASAPRGLLDTPELDISDNPLEKEGLYILRDALCADKLANLVDLYLAGSLTGDADANAELILALGSGHCCSLELLNLSRNNLGEPGGKALGKVLPHLHSGLSLYLGETMLGDKGISGFAQNVEGMCELGNLELMNNDIHTAGLSSLVKCICAGKISPSSIYVSLMNNPLGLEGVMVGLRMLNSCNFLSFGIDLSHCQLTTSGRNDADVDSLTCVGVAESICCQPRLFRAISITRLFIDNISFTGDRISILKSFMYMCPHLEALHCNNCGISSDDLEQLLIQLSKLNMKQPDLESWDLGGNDIDDVGASALIQHLYIFPNLEYTGLNNHNKVSPVMLEMLRKNLAESFWDKCMKKISQQVAIMHAFSLKFLYNIYHQVYIYITY